MLNSGVKKENNKTHILPLELLEEELVYDKEIPPGVFRHAIKLLRENVDNKLFSKKMLSIICSHSFNKCT